jgi:hypothetical protein
VHRVHAGYTVLLPVAAERAAAASELLAELAAQPERLRFAQSTTTHFATITILPAQTYRGEPLPATLLFATSFCGPARVHVRELVALMAEPLRAVFGCCEGFPERCSNDELEAFLVARRSGDAFYSGMQNLSPLDVERHHELREAIEGFLDERQAEGSLPETASGVRRAIQSFVRSRPELAWVQESFAPPAGTWLALHWRTLIAGAIAVPVLAALVACSVARIFVHDAMLGDVVEGGWIAVGLLVAFGLGLVLAIRDAERDQTYVAERQPDALVRELAATQNRPVVNEFTIVGPIKEEGTLRPLGLRMLLWLVARLAEGIPGLRAPIEIPTVATARWIAADRGRRLVFISNYTNSAEGYVRDFIDVTAGAKNINLSFGFGRGYPKTRWIVDAGAITDPNAFSYVVAANQRPTAFWYGPYRNLSIDNIRVNRQIREGVLAKLDDDDARKWLLLL